MGYDVTRFKEAQKKNYRTAFQELKDGKKESDWMDSIFPQMRGVGISDYYGLAGIEEAEAYMADVELGINSMCCLGLLAEKYKNGKSPQDVLGNDYMQLISCLTLFTFTTQYGSIFDQTRAILFGDMICPITLILTGKKHLLLGFY